MWVRQIILAVVGLSSGVAVAGGLFSFIIGLGLVSDFADRTHTGKYVLLYEEMIELGGILGNILFVYQISLPNTQWFLAIFGLCAGIFVGCWSMALAEILNIFPIFIRRVKILRGIPCLIVGMAVGKGIGAFVHFWNGW